LSKDGSWKGVFELSLVVAVSVVAAPGGSSVADSAMIERIALPLEFIWFDGDYQ
jgi:hypothetical protein